MKGNSLPIDQHSEAKGTDLNHFQRWFGLCLGIGSLLGVGNFVLDIKDGASGWHLFLEAFIAMVLLAITVYWFLPDSKNKSAKATSIEPASSSNDSSLRLDFAQQFRLWQFTPSESEIALLLLKGLSFDEIADVRQTKQKTVRQQATSIYRKANVNGRHEFAAWFIEDLI